MRENKKQNPNEQQRKAEKLYGRNLAKVTKIGVAIYLVIAVILSTLLIIMQNQKSNKLAKSKILDPELARAMTYEQFEPGSDDVYSTDGETKVDNVKFSAFFLRDLDGDGYAEKIKGTCKEIGTSDTLYMEINVLTNGKLKNAKVEIDGKNFYLLTALPKDQQIKNNAIGTNTKLIEFNDMVNGTQKLFAGMVRSGDYTYSSSKIDALGNNINNYSRNDNNIILTGTYEDENGNDTEIRKEIPLTMDWYGTTRTTIKRTYQNYNDLDSRLDEENQTINLSFNIITSEINNDLFLSKNHVQATIPEFNGYKPSEVKVTSGNVDYNYDEEARILTMERKATVDETGKLTKTVARDNTYQVSVKYPLEAYLLMGDGSVELLVPVEEYYEGYNNPNIEFTNPYKSNIAKTIVRTAYNKYTGYIDKVEIIVGDYISEPYRNYVISKRKPMRIYNGISTEEKDDTYKVQWYYYRGNIGEDLSHITLKETPAQQAQVSDQFLHVDGTYSTMEELTTNVGIYFNNLNNVISTDGEIKVYDEETGNLLLTVNKSSFNKYTQNNPYKYDTPVKHIRVEVYGMLKTESLTVTSIKELDDEYITTNYIEEEFNDLKQIKSTLSAIREGESEITVSRNALYEIPISIAKIRINKNVLSTQVTEKNDNIVITAEYNESKNEIGWTNGIFQVKLPDEINDTKINDISINNNSVKIDSYEYVENENGKFIKIYTSNQTPQSFNITINCNITPDPRIPTSNRELELYAVNEEGTDYYYKSDDIYDINGNSNIDEKINKTSTSISLVAPNSLLTNKTLSEFDEEGTIIISPNTADVSIRNVNVETEEKTAKIGVQIKNNYSNDISEVVILGKIPFEGNATALTNQDLGSTFTTKMTDSGIEVPEELQDRVDVYYSENETPTKDINDENNGWKTANEVENWDNIKTYLIDLKDNTLNPSQEYVFYYTVKIPKGTPYNSISNAHHGVYFALDTDEGKYRTSTEPSKIGIRVAEKYNVNLTKYQTNKEKKVLGATYSITDEEGTAKTATTNDQGMLTFNKLYVEKVYEVKEIRSPEDYETNGEAIRFIAHVTETGDIEIEKLSGETRGDITVTTDSTTNMPTVNLQTQDEAKAKLKIIKTEAGTENKLSRVSYKITGEGLPDTGKIIKTNINGEANISGLKVGTEYTLEETKAEGYYLNEPVEFTINNNNGTYELQVTGETKGREITLDNEIPTINLQLEDEKIPTYDLQINKIVKGSKTEENINGTPIQGAKFKLYKGTKEQGIYESDENGHIIIEGLYQYEQSRDIDQTYKLVETFAPEGYAKTMDITFSSQTLEGILQLDEKVAENGKAHEYTVEGNTIQLIIEDNPSFRLTKKDGETNELLPNTKFAIYNVDDETMPARNSKGEILGTKEIINGREYYTLTTDENGQITADLPEGLYKAVEVEADNKYDISPNTKYFGIGASREGKKVMTEEWGATYGESRDDEITSVVSTVDGGYISVGYFQGSVTIGEETYTSKGDSDGIIIKYSSKGEEEWVKTFGGSSQDRINSVANTADGGYIAGGYFYGRSVTIGGETYTNNSSSISYSDGIIIKYSSTGDEEWAKTYGGSGSDFINSVASTADGGYIAGGHFQDSVTIGGETYTSKRSYDGIIIKYSSTGDEEWAKTYGGNEYDYIESVASTADGGYIAGGYFESSSVTVEGETYTSKGSSDGIIIKYSSTGEKEWLKIYGGSNYDYIRSVASTADGGCIAGGDFQSSITIGGETYTSKGSYDGIIIKYNSAGEEEWVKTYGGSYSDSIDSVASTADGGYIAGGDFGSSSITIGGETYTNTIGGYSDGIIIKYSSTGEEESANTYGGSNFERIQSVASTADGGCIAGGKFYSRSVTIGEETYTSKGDYDGIIIKYTPKEITEVVVNQAKLIGGSNSDGIKSVASTADGGYIAGGYFQGSVTIGEETYTSKGYYDGIIIKYSSEGEEEWVKTYGGSDYDYINSVASTADGGYIAGGYFSDNIEIERDIYTSNGDRDGIIIKYSREGEEEWVKTYGGIDYDVINSVASTADGGYIAGGYFHSSSVTIGGMPYTSKESHDGIIIKYSSTGEEEWVQSYGGGRIDSVASTADGGYIAGGCFSSSVTIGGETYTSKGDTDGIIIKYSSTGEEEWVKIYGGSDYDYIRSVANTADGGYIAGGYFHDSVIIGGETYTSKGSFDGIIIKYSMAGEVEWAKTYGGSNSDYIISVASTADGGYIAGGYFESRSVTIGGVKYTCKGGPEGIVIKYSSTGEEEWVKTYGGSSSDVIYSVATTVNGDCIAGGEFNSSEIIDGKTTITNNGSYDGFVIKINPQIGVPEVQELTVENFRKQFKITTDVKEIDNIKGGNISGEDEKPYEEVKYGDTSTKQIIMTPDENYEIIGITVNGKEWQFEKNDDGTYTMPQFENMQENKHIVVTYALKDNKITINKEDSISGAKLDGAKFKLDQIDERNEPTNSDIIGSLTDNGQSYKGADLDNEITGALGELTNNGTYYFVEQDGKYVPTNSRTYQLANGGSGGKSGTAWSYIPIDLTGLEGTYKVIVNANVSSRNNYDYGFATINQSTTAPTYSTTAGRFIYITGTSTTVTTPTDYESTVVLQGGQTYYLHLGYRKASTSYLGTDQFVVNSIKLYKTKDVTYNFTENDGKYESTNQGKDSTVSNSYIPIDLSNYSGKYNITVNAEISTQYGDYGYVTVTANTTRPYYSDSTGRIMYITGVNSAEGTTEVQGGQMYYLHLGYYKDGTTNTSESDKFTVNSINISLSGSELYHTTLETNSEGQAITQIPFGKYKVTEIKTPDGYLTNENIPDIEFRSYDGAQHEFTIENEKKGKLIVHHYIKGTTEKVAKDEEYTDKIGEDYNTSPAVDLGKYELEIDETTGEQILPENAQGKYAYEDTIVTYYYVPRQIPLIVHHYIEGTETPVLLANGNRAEDVISYGEEGQAYTTNVISEEDLSDIYELCTVPENANGTYEYDDVEVTYYYKHITGNLTVHKIDKDTKENMSNVIFDIVEGEYDEVGEIGEAVNVGDVYKVYNYDKVENSDIDLELYVPDGWIGFKEVDGKYVAENCQWYVDNYDNSKQGYSYADAYIRFDLTDKEGQYVIKADVEASGSGYGCIYAWKTTNNGGRDTWIQTSGDISNSYEMLLEGGQTYEFPIEYYRSGASNDNVSFDVEVYKVENVVTETVNEVHKHSESTITGRGDKVEDAIGELKQDESAIQYGQKSFYKDRNKYIPMSSQKYLNDSGETASGTASLAYFEVDLENKEGDYELVVNAEKHGSNQEYLEIMISETEALSGNYTVVSHIDGESEAQDYSTTLNGGKKYYLYFRYIKNSDSTVEDYAYINNIELYELQADIQEYEYGFDKTSDGKLVSNIQGINNMYAIAAVPVDLRNEVGNYNLIINAEISSEQYNDYGYIRISESEVLQNPMQETNNIYQFTGEMQAQDYNISVEGGKHYYVYFVYYKNYGDYSNVGNDRFTINRIYIDLNAVGSIETDENGNAEIELPVGKYSLIERNTPSGYKELAEPTVVNVVKEGTTVTIENEKKKGTVTVHYYIEGTETSIIPDVTIRQPLGENYETNDDDVPRGYELVAEPENKTGVFGEEPIEVTYYYRQAATSVLVHHYKENTEERLSEDVTIDGKVGEEYTTQVATDIPSKYELVAEPTNKNGTMTADQTVVTYYYRLKDTSVLVHHYKEGTTESLSDDVTINGQVDDNYSTHVANDIPSKYELVAEPANKNGTMTEDQIVVTYYYRLKDTHVVVHHYIEGTEDKLSEDVTINGKVDDEYTTHVANDIPSKYELVAEPTNKNGTMTEDPIEVIYYYRLKDTSVLVHHYIEGTEDKLSEDVTINGKVDDDYTTTVANDIPSKYELVAEPDNKAGTMTEDQIVVTYYYRLKDTQVVVHHYIEGTEDKLSEDVTINGKVDDDYTTTVANDIPSKYELVAEPDNKAGTMTEDQIVVTYYYRLKDTSVLVHHYIENTEDKLSEDVIINGKVDDDYTTTVANDIPSKYELVAEPDNKAGTMTEDQIVVTYYYRLKDTQVVVHHYIENTTDKLSEDVTIEGKVDDDYTTTVANDIPSKYELVAEPTNKNGTMTEDPIEVIYYYRLKDTSVLVHHYIEGTEDKLSEDVTINGKVDDDYTTTVANDIPSKYELVATPGNAEGTMTEDQIVVTYYYRLKDTQVVVHHYIENTTDKLSEDVTIEGKVDDEYTTTVANDIPSKYELVAEPTNKNGTMTEDPIEVIYYYRLKDTSILVHHYIEGTEDKLSEDVTINGKVDDEYTTTVANDIPSKYELVAEPTNKNGTMTEDQIVVTYYYRLKDTKVTVHHYVENTTEKVSEDVVLEGKVDDPYTTSPATDIPEKYELASEPVNKEGTMAEDEIELIYYYKVKDANIIVKYLEKGTNEVLADQDNINGKVDESYNTEAKTITNYTLVEDSGNTSGHFTIEPIEVIYYYLQNTKATVQHIDKQTGRIIKEETKDGLVGDEFVTDSENFDGYVLVEEPVEKTVEMTKDEIVLKYYYSHISAGLIEKHVDVLTGDILANAVHEGKEGDAYNIPSKTFDGYDLVEERLPTNATGTMTIEPIEVVYYYSHKAKVTARYIDKLTGEELAPEEEQNGHAGDEYRADKKTFEGYRLEEVPENANGTMTKEDIVVTYYYIKNSGKVTVKYVDINTDKEIAERDEITGYVGENYETSAKDIEDYSLVQYKYPENANGKLTEGEQEVIYYYESPAKVTVTYYDIDTKEDLTNPVKIDGYKGKEYETEEKSFDYYKLVEVEGDKTGTMRGTTEVKYKYRKKAFNLSVDKIIASISINGKATAINSELGKAEVQRAELQKAKIQVIYTIKVTNNGELAGSATIQENIPEGMTMVAANNPEWTIGVATASIDTGNIEAGKTKEYTVVMDWENGEDTVGTKLNTVEIVNATNEAGFEETMLEDNKSGASMIVAVATGETAYIAITAAALIILIGAGAIIYKKTRKED